MIFRSSPQTLEQALTSRFEDFVSRHKMIHHASMVICSGDGSLEWSAARGKAHPGGEDFSPQSPYFIASITKTYTAVVILLLHERGMLSIDDRIAKHLPPELLHGLHVLDGVNYVQEITIAHLLGHTSGLADYFEGRDRSGKSFEKRLFEGQEAVFDLEEVLRIVREEMKPHFVPLPRAASGRRALYSDTNYQLLGAIIETVTQSSLQAAYETYIFGPLNLRETYLFGRDERNTAVHRSPAQIWWKDRPLNLDPVMACFGADGALVSTPSDQLSFLKALFQGRLFTKPETLSLMQQGWNKIWFPMEYGLGLMRIKSSRLMVPYRPPPTMIGHSGSSGTWLYHCPDLDLYLVGTIDQSASRSLHFRLLLRMLQVAHQYSQKRSHHC